MSDILEAIHTYIFVGLIELFGIFPSSLIMTALAYLSGFPFYLVLKGIAPSKSKLFLALFCLVASGIGSLPIWAGPGPGFPYSVVSILPLLLLPFGVYYLFILLDKIGFIRFDRHSPSNLQTTTGLIALFALPAAAVVDWVFFKGENICAKTGEFSVLLISFGLPAIGAFVVMLLLMPIIGLVSLMSATVRWLMKEKPIQPES
jgi:hypothetical protein